MWVCPDLPDHGINLVSAVSVGHPSVARPLNQPPELYVRGISLHWSPGQAILAANRYQAWFTPEKRAGGGNPLDSGYVCA